ncbi:NAD(P)/FAD-dependent oxidoreductase [Maribacter polysiphoniae]|uniref:Glutathione reductase (NADPH) n=2 Tax=Flavobacteriaceae TaxID=49546 RepID=A0A316EMB2_9FLAO|nr:MULTISPECIES: NAD(P)/FAD-dependent oxidoreductase [Flavobacteriaceae]MBD1260737.1 NAD(P)/FAD-dependent oxidoreductase [Maribacter polysiphoniae]PWK24130.1 glutathione reductase (NADPH) [Maribacter polysiphoniae]RPG33613.1 MAG: NAD(P)/FAD-dependent oxidoreductase [Muricauda sp. TMED12]RYC51608.1 pyridine nucleotide-disulfide oxidoreductase [Allomuricauda olearia]|tara:strand:+ start:4139 stop:5485 length:1347 start_codon:yes stop_codon:yes gene_type:complete
MKKYDVFVIGSGMAGMTVANKCASKGLKVGITDELPYGGTCALRGCDPKKVIIGATEVRDSAMRLKGKGIDTVPVVNWRDIMAFKQTFVDEMPPKIEKGNRHNDIDTYHSSAKFLSKNTLQLGTDTIEADKIVIATGAKPKVLDFEGGELALTSTDFLNLKKLPESVLFIGGGYIAFEFAHIAARSGANVTIVHRGERPLENFDPDIVSHLVAATEDLGVNLVLETEVTKIEKIEKGYLISGTTNGNLNQFEVEAVFNSAGRPPAIFDLELERANVAYSNKGISVNKYLQSTSNPKVYAAGDAAETGGLALTPVAVMEGHVVSSNILMGNSKEVDYPPMPTVVFTLPTMASVGMTETKAKNSGLEFRVNYDKVDDWFNARRLNVEEYAYKTIIDKNNGTVLGAHLIGPHCEETVNLFAMAIKTKMTVNDLRTMIFSYPTLSSDIPYML